MDASATPEAPAEYVDCSQHIDCHQCASNSQCGWCAGTGQCMHTEGLEAEQLLCDQTHNDHNSVE